MNHFSAPSMLHVVFDIFTFISFSVFVIIVYCTTQRLLLSQYAVYFDVLSMGNNKINSPMVLS